jgi:D-alanyl-D-alanine carboxypeptidase (penicillin-binding protein 5/6)
MLDSASTEAPASQPDPEQRRAGRRSLRRWLLSCAAVLLILTGGTLVAVQPLRQRLPLPTIDVTMSAPTRIPGTTPVLPWPGIGQAVVDVEGIGRLGTSGAMSAVPIASVTKIMTAYVVLSTHPLSVGEAGPNLVVGAKEAAAYPAEAKRGESLVRVVAGAVFTERQALEALLLPSANNMARMLGAWDAGTDDAFVAKMNAEAATLGMSATHYTDPSGFDPGTVSTAVDQVILARKAMELPVFAEIVAQTTATVPVAGTITNTNTALGQDGLFGIKTGSTGQAGGCLVFAARVTVGTAHVTIVGAVFGQPGRDSLLQLKAAFQASQLLIRAAGKALTVYTVIHAGQPVAAVHGPLGTGTTLNAGTDLDVVGWPGMAVHVVTDIPAAPVRLAAGAAHGRVTVTAGDAPPVGTALRAAARLAPPSTWTRIKRHR